VQAFLVVHGAQVGLHQAGERLRLGPVAGLAGLGVVDVREAVCRRVAVLFLVGLEEVVGAVALVGVQRFHERVGEHLDVAGGFPHTGGQDDGGVHADGVAAGLHHVLPPQALEVFFQLHAERAVVPRGAGTAVNLAGRVHQSAALAQVNDGLNL